MESANAHFLHGAESRRIQPKITMGFTSFREAMSYPQGSYQLNSANIFLAVIAENLVRLGA
jgi:hypothetical protein